MDYDKLKKARIYGTKIGPYHMITAVTQRAINRQLATMHIVNDSLKKFTVSSSDPKDDFSKLVANLDPPTVFLRLGDNKHVVLLKLNIKSGTLKYKANGKDTTIAIPACVLAFTVDLSLEGADFSSLPKATQTRLKSKNNYSVKQLLVDFTSANLSRVDVANSSIYNHVKDAAKTSFDNFIQRYFKSLGKKNGYIIHYVPLATTDGTKQYAMPTVAPTDFRFQNMGFAVDGKAVGGSDNNMLFYLQMTGGTPLPKADLAFSANWVVPEPNGTNNYDGTVALSRSIFLENWLLPQLAKLNQASSWVPKEAWWKQPSITTTIYKLSGVLGRDGATPADLKFAALPNADLGVDPAYKTQVGKTPGHWYKYYYNNKLEDGGVFNVFQNATTENVLFIPTGYNNSGISKILLWGSVVINLYVRMDITTSSTAWVTGKWGTAITLDGVTDGELNISIDPIKPDIKTTFEGKPMEENETAMFSGEMEKGLKKLSMTAILKAMGDVLTNEWDFVLPGAGDFYINKAAFNAEEDLICDIKYKFKA